MKKSKTIIILTLIAIAVLSSQNEYTPTHNPFERVEIPNSQLVTIYSSTVGQEYNLYIHLPRNYDDTTKTFPVLYLLDAQWDFSLMTALFGQQYFDGFVPEIIIVGITWGGKNANPDSLRVRDFSPNKIITAPQSGGAETFHAFIKNELIPFINLRYRTEKNNLALAGSSLGGLFTLYSFFTNPEVFNRYIVTSPALGWGNRILFSLGNIYQQHQNVQVKRVFMAEGSLEDGVGEFKQFDKYLRSQKIIGLEVESKVLDGIGHSGGKAEGYTRGLQFVYAKPSLHMSIDSLQHYAGIYSLNKTTIIKVQLEIDHLSIKISGGPKLILYAETEQKFYVKGQYLKIHFLKDDIDKEVRSLRIEQFGSEKIAHKMK